MRALSLGRLGLGGVAILSCQHGPTDQGHTRPYIELRFTGFVVVVSGYFWFLSRDHTCARRGGRAAFVRSVLALLIHSVPYQAAPGIVFALAVLYSTPYKREGSLYWEEIAVFIWRGEGEEGGSPLHSLTRRDQT